MAIGVADGVGGWASHGVDPSVFSRKLSSLFCDIVEQTYQKEQYDGIPGQAMLSEAHKYCLETLGSTTFCAALMRGEEISWYL
eukprot:gene3178-2145_t